MWDPVTSAQLPIESHSGERRRRSATVLPTHGYRVGVRSRWFWGDVDNLYLRLRNGGATRGKLTAVREFLRIHRGRDREEIWRWRDPAPFLLESLRRLSLRS